MAANGDLLEVLRGVSLFKGAARGELARLAASARRVDYLPRQKILREGDSGESCFVMLSGTVSVFVTDPVGGETEVARLGPGRVFGEQALIPGRANRRNASVRALTEVGVAEIPAAAFHGLLAAMPALNEVLDERANSQAQERLWRQSVLLSNMGEALQLPEQRSYVDGETVITQGETGSDVFLVLAGMARVERANGGQKQVLGRLSAGSFFGERALIRTEPRAASVIAESELQLLVIDGGRFLQAYQSNPGLRDLVEQLSAFYALSDQATVSLHKGRIDGKDTITALYVLADGRRFAASRIPDEAIFNLARLNVESRSVAQQETFSGDGGFRRSLHLVGGRLVGLAVAGPWRDLGFAFSAVIQERRLWPWQRALFRLRGELRLHRREVGSGMAAIVCQCTGRSRGQLLELLESECRDLECLVDRSGASLICGGCTPLLEELAGPADREFCRIHALEPLTAEVRRVGLMPIDGSANAFEPGQHIRVAAHVDGERLERSYTLTAGSDTGYEIMVKREQGGRFSAWVHDQARVGDAVRVSVPRGGFKLPAGQRSWLCLVAGIGVTPALALLRTGDWSERRRFYLDYSVRQSADIVCAEELRAASARPGVHVEIREVSRQGRLDSQGIESLLQACPDAEILVCGPAAYQTQVCEALSLAGVDPARVHVEAFTPAQGRLHRQTVTPWQWGLSGLAVLLLAWIALAPAWSWPAQTEPGGSLS